MSEINRLNHTGDAIAMPTMVPTHTSGQRFQQLIAQTPQENNNSPWDKAAELLTNTQYTDPSGTPQAYVNNGTLTEAGKSRIETAQDHLRHTTGASEVSIEQGAKQLLIEALTTQYANENNPALLQRAQQLQTELYSELTSTPSAAPQEVNPEPTLANLEPYLENQLQQLGLSRTEFEASTVDLGNGDVPVSALLATETSPRGQLQLLISIAAQQLRAQQVVAAQVPAAEPLAPPVVEPVKVTEIMKLQPGELYEFEVGKGSRSNVLDLLSRSFRLYQGVRYYGSTYHLQFLDANDKVIHLNPILDMPAAAGPEDNLALNARLKSQSNTFGQGSDQMSVYWHGRTAAGGTVYMLNGYALPSETVSRNISLVPSMMVDTEEGMQRMRMGEIPFAKIRVSNEGNQLLSLPTQADVDEARTALENPQNLTIKQLLKYTTPSLGRVDGIADRMLAAKEDNNLELIISNEFSGLVRGDAIMAKAHELSNFILEHRRGFELMRSVDDFFLKNTGTELLKSLEANKLNIAREEFAARIGQNLDDVGLSIHHDVDLRHIDLRGVDLSGQLLYRLDLRGVNLVGANLEGATLLDVKLDGANLDGANLRGALLEAVSLRGASLDKVNLTMAQLKNLDLEGASLVRATLPDLDLRKVKLSGVNLSAAELSNVRLDDVTLSTAQLQGANLRDAVFANAKLSDVNFRGADLGGATFFKSTLLGVDLTEAKLTGTFFSKVLIVDLTIDQPTLDNETVLKLISKPPFDSMIQPGMEAISRASTFESLKELTHQWNTVSDSRSETRLGRYQIDTIVLPQIKQRQRELILSGVSASDVFFSEMNLAHHDLTAAQLEGANFYDSDLAYVNLQGANLQGVKISGFYAGLEGADMQGANLTGASMGYLSAMGVQLQKANLRDAQLESLQLYKGDLSEADISGATLSNIDISDVNISNLHYNNKTRWNGVTLTQQQAVDLQLLLKSPDRSPYLGAAFNNKDQLLMISGVGRRPSVIQDSGFELPRATYHISRLNGSLPPRGVVPQKGAYNFEGLNLSGIDLSQAEFSRSNFKSTILRSADLQGATLRQANFERADLGQANFNDAKIQYADFRQVDLISASFINTSARGADFSAAQMQGSDFSGSDMGGAILMEANLENANLTGTDLRSADLRGANLRGGNLQKVQHDEHTQWQGARLTQPQIDMLGLSAEQLNGINAAGNAGLLSPGQSPVPPRDPDTPNSLQGGSSTPPGISGYGVSHTLKPFNNPNGIIGNDGTQAGHGNNGNRGNTRTAVANDPPDPDHPFQVINGQVSINGVLLSELALSQVMIQSADRVFGVPVGLPELPTYTPAPRTQEGAADIPVADISSETVTESSKSVSQQQGGVTVGGDLGNDKGKTAAELGLDPSGKLPGPEKTKAPDPIPGYGEGVNTKELNQTNTRDWGGGPVTPDQAKLTPEGFPQKDKTLEGILNPEGPSSARFKFPPGNEEIPAAEYQTVVKALPALQQISVGEYSQLSTADQKNILSRAVEYQSLPADIKANTRLLQYADSGQTSASQRGQMLSVQQKQTVQTAQQRLSGAQSGLSDSTIQLINTRINALQQNTAAINQQTQVLTHSNTNRQSTLVTPTTTDPVAAAFIKPDIKPDQTPPASNSTATPQINSQSSPIPRFMVIRTANGPQLMENLANGKTQMLPYPIPADTPITRQASNGRWSGVPDAYAIGAKNLLDTLFLQGAVKMLNNGNAVQSPSTQSAPQAPIGVPQPAF